MEYKTNYFKQLAETERRNRRINSLVLLVISLFILITGLAFYIVNLEQKNDKLTKQVEQLESKNYNMSKKYNNLLINYANMKLKLQYQDQSQLNKVIEHIDNTFYIEDIPLTLNQQRYIHKLCDEYDLDYELILGLIDLESNFKTDAINYNTNGTVDKGLGQINSGNIDWLEQELNRDLNLYNFKDNIDSMFFILNHYKDDNIYKHFTSYNRGSGGANRFYRKHLTYKSQYAKILLQRAEKYK